MAIDAVGRAEPHHGGLVLVFQEVNGEKVHLRVNASTSFEIIISAYCARRRLDEKAMRFLCNGYRICRWQTPEELGLEQNDHVDDLHEQIG